MKKNSEQLKNSTKNIWNIRLIRFLTLLAAGAILYYFMLPPLNLKSMDCWFYLAILALLYLVIYYISEASRTSSSPIVVSKRGVTIQTGKGRASKKPLLVLVALILIPLLFYLIGSSRFLHARKYSRILEVSDGTVESIPSVEKTSTIALMDTASAEKLGNREIGTLSGVVSQYNVSSYTQIDYQGTPVKVSPLRYDGFFKWYRNRENGVPGYVIVNPVSMEADYIALKEGITYVPSACFGENLSRYIRFHYPTIMFDNLHFEIDEDGNPWYVASVYDHTVGLLGGEQVTGAILVNPVNGEIQSIPAGEVPTWVDVVFPGDLICTQYNDYAQLHEGFWNSVFGQSGCRKVTEYQSGDEEDDTYYSDYGYIAKDGDIWIYTGVTSLNNDSSNIGFILSNERTEETIFIPCSGADEFSAMASAEGEVQEKRYTASFPSLILLNDRPAYIMVLKDASGLVKMYACVNVEQYNMVATAGTQEECIAKYEALLSGRISQAQATSEEPQAEIAGSVIEENAADLSEFEQREIVIKKLQTIDRDGNTYMYVVDSENRIYHAKYTDVIQMLLTEEGDSITILTDGERFVLE